MAIAFDAATDGGYLGSGSPKTFNHTVGSGDNRLLIVGGFDAGSSGTTITGVTYNGVAMTYVNSVKNPPENRFSWMYYLLNPDTGTHAVSISFSSGDVGAWAVSYTGVAQSGQPDANGTDSASGVTSRTTSLTSIADNCWHMMTSRNNVGAAGAGAGATSRVSSAAGGGFVDSNGPKTPAGSYSMNVTTGGGSGGIANVIATFKPAVASGPANVKTWDGLATASTKTINGLAIGSTKTKNGLA